MTLDATALRRMLVLETAAEQMWRDLSPHQQRAYVEEHPDTVLAMPVAVGERARLERDIGTRLRALAGKLHCEPAHARFLHQLHQWLDAEQGAVEAQPLHARRIRQMLVEATSRGIPDADAELPEHDEHGNAASELLDSARASIASAADHDHADRMLLVKSAADALRIANHLQKGHARSAHAHVAALPLIEREALPSRALLHVRRHAGGKLARTPVGSMPRVVKEQYRDVSVNGHDAMRMNSGISRRGSTSR